MGWIWASASLAGGCLFTTLPLPVSREEAPGAAGEAGFRVFWGDLHVHTEYSSDFRKPPYPGGSAPDCPQDQVCDNQSGIDYMFRNARRAGLDFVAVTDHAEDLTQEEWRETRAAAERHHETGRFVPIRGYELCEIAGREVNCANILLPDLEEGPLLASTSLKKAATGTAPEYLHGFREASARLEAANPGALAFLAYTQTGMFRAFSDAEKRVLVGAEVTTTGGDGSPHEYRQCHGQYLAGLRKGMVLAALGSSNNHEADPGQSSLTAVLARDLSREALFEALRSRRTYATRGARIALSLDVDGSLMGEVIAPAAGEGPRVLRISAGAVLHDASLGSLALLRLKGGVRSVLGRVDGISHDLEISLPDTLLPGDTAAYWTEAALAGNTGQGPEAWSTPVFVQMPAP